MDEIRDIIEKTEAETKDELVTLLKEKQSGKLRSVLSEMNEADLAAIMDTMEDEESLKIFRILPKNMAADVFPLLEVADQTEGSPDRYHIFLLCKHLCAREWFSLPHTISSDSNSMICFNASTGTHPRPAAQSAR